MPRINRCDMAASRDWMNEQCQFLFGGMLCLYRLKVVGSDFFGPHEAQKVYDESSKSFATRDPNFLAD